MNLQKQKRWRCRSYLDWVKTLPCVVSGAPADDPHHVIGYDIRGIGLKAPDWASFPLTRHEHELLHHIGAEEWEKRHGSQWYYVAQTLGRAIDDGVLRL